LDEQQELACGLEAQLRSVGDADAVQEGFLRAFQHGKPDKLANPQGYWYRASRNALHDRRRRRSAEDRAIRSWLEIHPRDQDAHRWTDEQLSDLHRGIDQLTGRRRRLIELELSGVRDGRALADALGISEGATRVLRHRTYRQLRLLLAR
jgi:RNA polymerase sigma factor (sigma-70 family)